MRRTEEDGGWVLHVLAVRTGRIQGRVFFPGLTRIEKVIFNFLKKHKNPQNTYSQREGGRVERERRGEGQQFTKLGRKYKRD